jgi:hypothetical protein
MIARYNFMPFRKRSFYRIASPFTFNKYSGSIRGYIKAHEISAYLAP